MAESEMITKLNDAIEARDNIKEALEERIDTTLTNDIRDYADVIKNLDNIKIYKTHDEMLNEKNVQDNAYGIVMNNIATPIELNKDISILYVPEKVVLDTPITNTNEVNHQYKDDLNHSNIEIMYSKTQVRIFGRGRNIDDYCSFSLEYKSEDGKTYIRNRDKDVRDEKYNVTIKQGYIIFNSPLRFINLYEDNDTVIVPTEVDEKFIQEGNIYYDDIYKYCIDEDKDYITGLQSISAKDYQVIPQYAEVMYKPGIYNYFKRIYDNSEKSKGIVFKKQDENLYKIILLDTNSALTEFVQTLYEANKWYSISYYQHIDTTYSSVEARGIYYTYNQDTNILEGPFNCTDDKEEEIIVHAFGNDSNYGTFRYMYMGDNYIPIIDFEQNIGMRFEDKFKCIVKLEDNSAYITSFYTDKEVKIGYKTFKGWHRLYKNTNYNNSDTLLEGVKAYGEDGLLEGTKKDISDDEDIGLIWGDYNDTKKYLSTKKCNTIEQFIDAKVVGNNDTIPLTNPSDIIKYIEYEQDLLFIISVEQSSRYMHFRVYNKLDINQCIGEYTIICGSDYIGTYKIVNNKKYFIFIDKDQKINIFIYNINQNQWEFNNLSIIDKNEIDYSIVVDEENNYYFNAYDGTNYNIYKNNSQLCSTNSLATVLYIKDNYLYISDKGSIYKIDTNTGEKLKTYENVYGETILYKNNLYIYKYSRTMFKIYKLENDEFIELFSTTDSIKCYRLYKQLYDRNYPISLITINNIIYVIVGTNIYDFANNIEYSLNVSKSNQNYILNITDEDNIVIVTTNKGNQINYLKPNYVFKDDKGGILLVPIDKKNTCLKQAYIPVADLTSKSILTDEEYADLVSTSRTILGRENQ